MAHTNKTDCSLYANLQTRLDKRRKAGNLRGLGRPISDPHHQFSSNDYLDLSTYAPLRAMFSRYLEIEPALASTGSRLLSGNSRLADSIEDEARTFWSSADSLIAGTGYEANVALFSTLPLPGDTVICDELVHASVHVGLKTSRATNKLFFKHNNLNHLKSLLREQHSILSRSNNIFLSVESVYSMDGDLAPLDSILHLIRTECPRTKLILDEAHATGVFGSEGRGLLNHLGLDHAPEVLVRLHTFGKGLGGTGAIILCDTLIKQYLLNYSKGLIYSTFLSTPALCLMRASLALLRLHMTVRRQAELWEVIAYTQQRLQLITTSSLMGIPPALSSPIIPILTPNPVMMSTFLERRGFKVMPVRYPTVPKGKERIRLCLRAGMNLQAIDGLVRCIEDWLSSEDTRIRAEELRPDDHKSGQDVTAKL